MSASLCPGQGLSDRWARARPGCRRRWVSGRGQGVLRSLRIDVDFISVAANPTQLSAGRLAGRPRLLSTTRRATVERKSSAYTRWKSIHVCVTSHYRTLSSNLYFFILKGNLHIKAEAIDVQRPFPRFVLEAVYGLSLAEQRESVLQRESNAASHVLHNQNFVC